MARQHPVGHSLLITEASESHSVTQVTLGKIRPDERSARRWELYLTKHNIQKTQISMQPARFEPAIPGSERPQTRASDSAATWIGLQTIFRAPCFGVFIISRIQNFVT